MTKRRNSKQLNRARKMQELELERTLQEVAEKQERHNKLQAAKAKQIRKNRKNEWTVIWQGGPHSRRFFRSQLISGSKEAGFPLRLATLPD